MNNEETTFLNPNAEVSQEEKKKMNPWKYVTLGGVPGILMGAGVLYAGQTTAKQLETTGEAPEDVQAPEAGETSHTLENGLQVAAVNDDLSFGEAFAAARAEVGPGGVFHWHGGIYNTYTAEEWNSMTLEQKHDFAQQVKPEIHPEDLSTPTDANSHVVVVHHVYHHHEESAPVEDVHQASASEDVQMVDEQTAANFVQDGDVHVVGYTTVEGHLAVGYDTTGDGQADVAIIDVDDNHDVSDPDIIIDNQGNMATVGEVFSDADPNEQTASNENPDVAPDMPDYMNDAMIDV